MYHSTGMFRSADGLELYYQRWSPERETRASIAIQHGLGGHSGQSSYTHLVDHLVPLGYALYSHDLRGHGRSGGRRGSINDWEEYRSDLRLLLHMIKGSSSDQPVFLLGQSLGGLIVLEYSLNYPQDMRGVIASAPVLSVPKKSRVLTTVAKLLSPILPHVVIGRSRHVSGDSRDPEELQRLLDDPLAVPGLSLRLAVEMLSTLQWTQAHAANLQVPLLLIHGDADPVTPARGSLVFFNNVKIEDKALKLYEGGYHQAFIDSHREQVLADVAHWLDEHA